MIAARMMLAVAVPLVAVAVDSAARVFVAALVVALEPVASVPKHVPCRRVMTETPPNEHE